MFERSQKQVVDGRKMHRQAVGSRPEDFAEQHPDEAIATLTEIVCVLADEGDLDGARHWQTLADELGDWLKSPPTADPWEEEPCRPREPEAAKPKKESGTQHKVPRMLRPNELRALMDAIDTRYPTGARNYAFLTLVSLTGLRVGEAVTLKLDSIDYDRHEVKVESGKTGQRVVPLPAGTGSERIREAIALWMKVRDGYWHTESPYLFVTSKGKKMQVREPERFIKRYADRAGITRVNVTPHVLRHTYARAVLDKTHNVYFVKELLGHKHITTTMKYLEVSNDELKRAMEGFDVL